MAASKFDVPSVFSVILIGAVLELELELDSFFDMSLRIRRLLNNSVDSGTPDPVNLQIQTVNFVPNIK
jgi:hypothetical protein